MVERGDGDGKRRPPDLSMEMGACLPGSRLISYALAITICTKVNYALLANICPNPKMMSRETWQRPTGTRQFIFAL